MILLLLSILLFGAAAADLSRPHSRVLVMQKEIGSAIADDARREAAQASADRMVETSAATRGAAKEFEHRLAELDAAATFRDSDYMVALDTALDAVDAVERRLLELEAELRGQTTAEEWTALKGHLMPDGN